jgi:integrase
MNVSASDGRSPLGLFAGRPAPRRYDCALEALRSRDYSRRTKEAYLHSIRRFLPCQRLVLCGRGHVFPDGEMGQETVDITRSEFARMNAGVKRSVLFLYQHVLEQPLDRIDGVVRARKPKRLPVVLTRDEAQAILTELDGVPRLVCGLLYGAGLRLLEGVGRSASTQMPPASGAGNGYSPLLPTTWTERRASGIVTIGTNP